MGGPGSYTSPVQAINPIMWGMILLLLVLTYVSQA